MNLPNSTRIQEAQNKDENLIIQSAAGHFFNNAEYMNYTCWILCVISAILSLKSDDTVFIIIMVMIDVLAVICDIMMEKHMKYAADLRRLFDHRVILGDDKEIAKSEKRRLKELAACYFGRYKESCQRDMQNTGNDKPPGKRNWYEFIAAMDSPKAQVECIEQNKWWDKKLSHYRCVLIALLHIVFIASAFFLCLHFHGMTVTAIINAVAIIIFRYGKRIRFGIRRYLITVKAEATLDMVREQPTLYGIKKLMGYVDEYRRIPIFGTSILYKISARRLLETYRSISKE